MEALRLPRRGGILESALKRRNWLLLHGFAFFGAHGSEDPGPGGTARGEAEPVLTASALRRPAPPTSCGPSSIARS